MWCSYKCRYRHRLDLDIDIATDIVVCIVTDISRDRDRGRDHSLGQPQQTGLELSVRTEWIPGAEPRFHAAGGSPCREQAEWSHSEKETLTFPFQQMHLLEGHLPTQLPALRGSPQCHQLSSMAVSPDLHRITSWRLSEQALQLFGIHSTWTRIFEA